MDPLRRLDRAQPFCTIKKLLYADLFSRPHYRSNSSSFQTTMDITGMLNTKGPSAVAAAEQQLQLHLAQAAQTHGRTASEAGSEIDNNSEHSSGYSSRSAQPLQAMPNIPNGMHYSSSSHMQQPMPMLTNTYTPQGLGIENGYPHQQHQEGHSHESESNHEMDRSAGNCDTVKAFACTNCKKGFARRSDLARHGKHCLF